MIAARRTAIAALACAATFSLELAGAQSPGIQTINGQQYQVTSRMVQVPVQQVANQTQTFYTQKVTTQTVQQQQQYSVPVTQYQLVSRLHGRWNPFITPYWTHNYEPVTTYQQQTATVQIPVNTVAWVPETRNVQMPTTTYKTVEQLVMTPIVNGSGAMGGSQQMMASSGTTTTSPSATLVARAPGSAPPAVNATPLSSVPSVASAPTTYGAAGAGGTQLNSDPPRGPTGSTWQTPPQSSYR